MTGTSSEIAQLLSRVALGDRAAFLALYDRTSPKLFGLCLRLLRDRAQAEDALQETFVKVWRNAGSYGSGGQAPMGWLCAVARHQAIDMLRARGPRTEELEEAAPLADAAPSPESLAVSGGEMARIARCMDELEADRGEAVRLAYVDGYTYAELAERYGVPVNTMRTWLFRSLRRLRACLEGEGSEADRSDDPARAGGRT